MSRDPVIENVLLIGTGALKNAWGPVCAAIDELYPHLAIGDDSDAANFWFSRLVQMWRFTAAHSQMSAEELLLQGVDRNDIPGFKRDATRLVRENRTVERLLKKTIAAHIQKATASGEMALSNDFIKNIRNKTWTGPTAIITTNWDQLLEQAISKRGGDGSLVWHLHGHVEDARHMLLPSELPEEPYRTKKERRHIANAQRRWKAFNHAKRIVIYGLSLSPLDASLAQTVAAGLDNPASGKAGEIYVMNCGPPEVERVAKRVKMLCEEKWPWTIHQVDCCEPN